MVLCTLSSWLLFVQLVSCLFVCLFVWLLSSSSHCDQGPVFLFFSVNGSGHFCGMAQMLNGVDYHSSAGVWAQDKWKGNNVILYYFGLVMAWHMILPVYRFPFVFFHNPQFFSCQSKLSVL